MRRITLDDIKSASNEAKNYVKGHKEECTIYISLMAIGVGASMISYVVGAHKGVKAGYEAGVNANIIDDLYNMPPELVKLIKEIGSEVFNF